MITDLREGRPISPRTSAPESRAPNIGLFSKN